MAVTILSLSDIKQSLIYSSQIRTQFPQVNLAISCGDLPYYYLEYVISMLDVPLLFVRGNHDKVLEYTESGSCTGPNGAIDLHRRVVSQNEVLYAGVEGSLRYSRGPYQYTQTEMWSHIIRLTPALFWNKIRHGRYLDVFVSHAPPRGIHDQIDLPHRGIDAFRWLLRTFKPAYHFHGHIHIYRPDDVTETFFDHTCVINTYGYKVKLFEHLGDRSARSSLQYRKG